MMTKRVSAMLLALAVMLTMLAGCGDDSKDETNGSTYEYKYVVRDLPEPKYITPAEAFAGGSGTADDPYQIADAAQLALLGAKMTDESKDEGYSSAHYVLTADIELNDVENFDNWGSEGPEYSWMPLGFEDDTEFAGVFDGDGHKISGLYINVNCEESGKRGYGLFCCVKGTVKNLSLENAYLEVSGMSCNVGAVAADMWKNAAIENCSVDAVIKSYDGVYGGIVGRAAGGAEWDMHDEENKVWTEYSTISGCTFTGSITQIKDESGAYLGGIVGSSHGNVQGCTSYGEITFNAVNIDSAGGIAAVVDDGCISGCTNNGKLVCDDGDGRLTRAGGIAGNIYIMSAGSEKYMSHGVEIRGCTNNAEVAASSCAGGIVGGLNNDGNKYCISISGCVNNAPVSKADYCGGIVAQVQCASGRDGDLNVVVEKCENRADISVQGSGAVGGIAGQFMCSSGDIAIRGCTNYGSLATEGQNCAGIIAYWLLGSNPDDMEITVSGCVNEGSISSGLNAGGIVSFMDAPTYTGDNDEDIQFTIENCTSTGNMSVSSNNGYVGGIAGNWGMRHISTTISSCKASGELRITAPVVERDPDDDINMTISRIIGGIVGRAGEGLLLTTDNDKASDKNIQAKNAVLKIENCASSCTMVVNEPGAEEYTDYIGGVIGNASAADGFSVLVTECTYSGADRGLGNTDLPDVGTKK